jgi:hypothetical protein
MFAAITFVASSLVACDGKGPTDPSGASAGPQSGSAVERYFPIVPNRVYAYDLEENGDKGLLTLRTRRVSTTAGELVSGGRNVKHFTYFSDRVEGDSFAVLLKAPLEGGKEWTSQGINRVQITLTDKKVSVPAGNFEDCIETTSTPPGAKPGQRTITTYCPDVGMVKLEVTDGSGGSANAVLKSYAAPIDPSQ